MKIKIKAALVGGAAAAAIAATAGVAGAANADALTYQDQNYLTMLAQGGIVPGGGYSYDDLASLGHNICYQMRAGAWGDDVAGWVWLHSEVGRYHAGYEVWAAQTVLCPDQLGTRMPVVRV